MDCDAERKLWNAVVIQAIRDVFGDSNFERRSALRWIFEKNKDFPFVCELAGISPQFVQTRVFNQIIRGE